MTKRQIRKLNAEQLLQALDDGRITLQQYHNECCDRAINKKVLKEMPEEKLQSILDMWNSFNKK